VTTWSVRLGGRTCAAGSNGERTFVVEDSLGYLVNRAARRFSHELADALRPDAVGIGQWAVLLILWARDHSSQAELARLVAIEPPTMVRTLDRMVRDGYVTRQPDARDGRVVRISLTDRGWSLRDLALPKAAAVNRTCASALSSSERAELGRLLAKLIAGSGSNA
jgi:DNA-binding MarR family transcriptional regulator